MQVIGISGKAGSGKTTFANMLVDALDSLGISKDLVRISPMADSVYRIASKSLGLTKAYLKENKQKELPDLSMTVREYLQRIGESMRKGVDPYFWVLIKRRDVLRLYDDGYRVIIIDDIRYPNEVEMVMGIETYVTIRMMGRAINIKDNHPSEISLDQYSSWDYMIDNSHSLAELKEKAQRVAKGILT